MARAPWRRLYLKRGLRLWLEGGRAGQGTALQRSPPPTVVRGGGLRLLALLRRQGVAAADTTVRRALHRLGYRWKRPRFVLSRRAEHWRQAKGGSAPD